MIEPQKAVDLVGGALVDVAVVEVEEDLAAGLVARLLQVDGAEDGVGLDAVFLETHLEWLVGSLPDVSPLDDLGSAQEGEDLVFGSKGQGLAVGAPPGTARRGGRGGEESQDGEPGEVPKLAHGSSR